MDDFLFQPGTASDAAVISALVRELASGFLAQPDGCGAEAFWASIATESQARRLDSDQDHYLLARDGDTLAGFIGIHDHSHLFHLFVATAYQGRGLASALWQRMRRELSQLNPGYWTVNSSPVAVPVYEHFGFRLNGPLQTMHGVRFQPMRKNSP